jgi:hypothetical protein
MYRFPVLQGYYAEVLPRVRNQDPIPDAAIGLNLATLRVLES